MKYCRFLQSKRFDFNFDVIVIGNGLIGAAASKYLQLASNRVAAIGAVENVDPTMSHVFSSHYDEGRVQRVLDNDKIWRNLNQQSVHVYKQLQSETGVSFHKAVGCLYVSTYQQDNQLEFLHNSPSSCGRSLNYDQLKIDFPEFSFPTNISGGYLEYDPVGYIHPRGLIEAQLAMLTKNQGTIVNDTVIACKDTGQGVEVRCISGNKYTAHKALVAGGAFTNFFDLLPQKLDLTLKGETVLLAEVSAASALVLSRLPSLLFETQTNEVEGIYSTPPLFYPPTPIMKGGWYIKLGCNLSTDIYFHELHHLQEWFRSSNTTSTSDSNLSILREVFQQLMPSIQILSYTTKRCVLTRTLSKRQFIGRLRDSNIYVATGGNGYSAMCSDALGNLSSYVVRHDGEFPSKFCKSDFLPQYANSLT